MNEDLMLAKTNRVNILFDYYGLLLTDKQQIFVKLYFHDDYSLGEIAAEFQISRQAVYEHIKRAEAVLEDYELKLQLHDKHKQRQIVIQQLEQLVAVWEPVSKRQSLALLEQLSEIE
ncbi:putative DNA-binding protein [Paenibacillus agricola]|uniref:UPF0122 protein G9U52_01045 n=1 Tax=Paenibacillus agricola TaxID=2716264 RepID=A0ABX0IX66_9BACL|nr:putative DNA-binding protein [Paenibacillus agricola]NHN28412.1 putative DNA-binding protein [Paenibacillus agricola]